MQCSLSVVPVAARITTAGRMERNQIECWRLKNGRGLQFRFLRLRRQNPPNSIEGPGRPLVRSCPIRAGGLGGALHFMGPLMSSFRFGYFMVNGPVAL